MHTFLYCFMHTTKYRNVCVSLLLVHLVFYASYSEIYWKITKYHIFNNFSPIFPQFSWNFSKHFQKLLYKFSETYLKYCIFPKIFPQFFKISMIITRNFNQNVMRSKKPYTKSENMTLRKRDLK